MVETIGARLYLSPVGTALCLIFSLLHEYNHNVIPTGFQERINDGNLP
jgi:hypothetical protein